VSKNIIEGFSVLLVAVLLQHCRTAEPPTEDERQIRTLFQQLAQDLPSAKPELIAPYLTESAHHESEGPYHHRPIVELLMRFRSLQNIEIELRTVSVADGRAHVRCLIRGKELRANGSTAVVEQEQIFELLQEPKGWHIADHLIS